MALKSYNAADYLDKTTVLSACDKIDTIAKDYYDMGRKVKECAVDFSKDALSIEGKSLESAIEDSGNSIRDVEGYINDFTDEIRDTVNAAYSKLQSQLDEQRRRDEAAARASSN